MNLVTKTTAKFTKLIHLLQRVGGVLYPQMVIKMIMEMQKSFPSFLKILNLINKDAIETYPFSDERYGKIPVLRHKSNNKTAKN
ncbi:MAG: hypothetical protein LUB59_00555 [Candidatus Gastranaerophilales bacterium]|nr:hypothetical protein [Candidatus Gastranaerophilales bacterium]